MPSKRSGELAFASTTGEVGTLLFSILTGIISVFPAAESNSSQAPCEPLSARLGLQLASLSNSSVSFIFLR